MSARGAFGRRDRSKRRREERALWEQLAAEGEAAKNQYDLMVVDECHRGYLLDREMSDAEVSFRSEAD